MTENQSPFWMLLKLEEIMRMVMLAIFFSMSIGITAEDRETVIPVDAYFPQIGKGWEKRDDDGNDVAHSWVNFDHGHKPGEVLALVFWRVQPSAALIGGPIGQASIEMFLSDGSAGMSSKRDSNPIADMVRFRTIPIIVRANAVEHAIETIEHTYVYESKTMAPRTIAHGYCFVLGATAIFIQHTAPYPITSQLAYETAGDCMINLLGFSEKTSTFDRGKILQSFD